MKEEIRKNLLSAGVAAVGFSRAGKVEDEVTLKYDEWIAEGFHGEMEYLRRHAPLKRTTNNVLPGAKTVISLAFSYFPDEWRDETLPYVSAYAYSEDYHIVLRERLRPIVEGFKLKYGGIWRICIDSAPISERYWALRSGIGRRGLNGAVIVDGCGAFAFLVEILTTLELDPDTSSEEKCMGCRKCIDVCPSGALCGDGTMDARRCINYLTIEKKGDFSDEEKNLLREGNGYLFGCDKCLRICPHNSLSTHNSEIKKSQLFKMSESIRKANLSEFLQMDGDSFKSKFNRSPLQYAGYPILRRNSETLINSDNSQ